MPVISMFHGIIIRMYLLDTQNHHLCEESSWTGT